MNKNLLRASLEEAELEITQAVLGEGADLDTETEHALACANDIDEAAEVQDHLEDAAQGLESIALTLSQEGFAAGQPAVVEMTMLAINAHLKPLGLESLFQAPAMESYGDVTSEELSIALEGVVGNIAKGIGNAFAKVMKSIGDWWANGANAMRKIAAQARGLKSKVRGLGAPKHPMIKLRNANTLQTGGKAEIANILKGFESLQVVEKEVQQKVLAVAEDYFRDVLTVVKETATWVDTMLEEVPHLVSKRYAIVMAVIYLILTGPIGAVIGGAVSYLGMYLESFLVTRLIALFTSNPKRKEELEQIINKAVASWDKMAHAMDAIGKGHELPGGKLLVGKHNGKSKQFDALEIVNATSGHVDATVEIHTPSKGDLDKLLTAVESSERYFRTGSTAFKELETLLGKVTQEMKADLAPKHKNTDRNEHNAIDRAQGALLKAARRFAVPMASVSRLNLSASRSALGLVNTAISAYEG